MILIPAPKTDAELYELQAGCCFYCDKYMRPHPWRNSRHPVQARGYTRDHVTPQAHGGNNDLNIVLACYRCNNEKDERAPTPEELELCRLLYCGRRLADAKIDRVLLSNAIRQQA